MAIAAQVKADDAARLKALDKEIQAAENELAKLQKNAAGLMKKAEQLQGHIENVGGAKMKKQKQTVSDLQQVWCTISFIMPLQHCCEHAEE